MNLETGQSGIHAVELTATGSENRWQIMALVDFGDPHSFTDPKVLSVLGEDALRELRDEINELLT